MIRKIISVAVAASILVGTIVPAKAGTTYNIENSKVDKYISEVSYPSEDYSDSEIANYTTKKSDRYDRPKAIKIKFKKTSKKVTIKAGTNKKVTQNVVSVTCSGKKGYGKIYNVLPNKTYYYKVVNTKKKTIKKGSFKTTGQVRMCFVNGVYNVRDLGGWSTLSGKTICYGKIYRGGEMNRGHSITTTGKKRMKEELKIKTVIDFRSDEELKIGTKNAITTCPLGKSVDYHHLNIKSYQLIQPNSDVMKDIFTTMFESVDNGKPVYFHCVVGCDRTGTIAFLTEALLGVRESDLSKDYELSSFYHNRPRNSTENNFSALVAELKTYEGDTIYDNAEQYFLSLGFTQDELDNFRNNMLQ